MVGHRDLRDRQKLTVRERERLRQIIEAEEIITKLNAFATAEVLEGKSGRYIARRLAMTADQLSTSFGLLKKVLPDLQSVEYVPDPESAADLTDEQLAAIVRAAGLPGADEPGDGSVH
jgi:hypothetical protein